MLESSFNAHEVAMSMLQPRTTVLDVGCGTGRFAELARSLGSTVTGIDVSAENIDAMTAAGFEAFVVDLEDDDSLQFLDGRIFDHVAALDVLEHVRNPDQVLARITKLLAPGGELILSIPNVTHLDVRLELLQGRFTYTDEGLLDRTHLRFFDRSSVDLLVQEAGLEVIDVVEVCRGAGEFQVEGLSSELISEATRHGDAAVQNWVLLLSTDGHPLRKTVVRRLIDESAARADVIDEATLYLRTLEAKLTVLEEELEDARLLQREVEYQDVVIRRLADRADDTDRSLLAAEARVAEAARELAAARRELLSIRRRLFYRFGDRFITTLYMIPGLRRLPRVVARTVSLLRTSMRNLV